MARRAVVIAAAMSLGACAADPVTDTPRPIRLVERLGQAEATGEPVDRRPPAARPSRLLRPRDRDHLWRIALEAAESEMDERLAIVLPAGGRLRFSAQEVTGARLRLGLGRLAEKTAAAADRPVRAVIRALDADGERVILEKTLDGPRWADVETALDPGPGLSIELAAEGPAGTWVAFSSPELDGGRPDGWDLILISLDTLRADHLGSYGYDRPTSPNLDAFAAGAFRFERAFSPAPWTLPSHQSLFNGLYPLSHGELRSPPLAKALWLRGYRTEARAGGGVMDYRMGSLSQGFDSYRYQDWIRDLDGLEASLAPSENRRRFLFLHTYEPHDPYIDTRFARALPSGRIGHYFDKYHYPKIRRDMTDDERRYVEALYDGDIAYTDEQLGELLGRLESSGALERSIVVIVSDHGEQFWEHGSWRHGQNLYDEQIHVPLILRLPAGLRRELGLPASGVIADQVRLIDLYPTLLELLQIPLQHEVQGRSLVPLLRGEEISEAEALAEHLNLGDVESRALRFRGFKLLRTWPKANVTAETRELYDLRRDPAESANLVAERPEIADELLALLERIAGGAVEEGVALETDDLDSDLRRDLEALGYIGN